MAKTMGVRQAAEEFGLPESLIYNAVARGQLPGVSRWGKRIILNREQFEEFIEGIVPAKVHIGDRLVETVVEDKPIPRTTRTTPTSRTIPDFVITAIESMATEGMSAKEIWRRLGGKRTGEETIHDGRTFRMPSQWTVNKYSRLYHEAVLGYRMKPGGHLRKTKQANENAATVQQETNEVNRHRITIGNTFDCVNCGERFKKNHRLILTAMQGGDGRGESKLTSYALCGASCLIEFTTKKEQEQWILTPLRSKEDLEPAETTGGGQRSFLRRLRDLAGGKE